MNISDFFKNNLNESVREHLIKDSDPALLDQALTSSIKNKILLLLSWLQQSKEEISNLRPNISMIEVDLLQENLQDIIKTKKYKESNG